MPATTGVDILVRLGHSRRTVTLTNGSAGETFTLTLLGESTAQVAFDADAATVQAALEALDSIEPGDVVVAGAAGGPYTLTFGGRFAGQEMGEVAGAGTGDLGVDVTDPGPEYVTVAGQRGATLNRGTSTADTTSKDDAGWESNIPTNANWSIDFDGLYITGDAGYEALRAAHRYRRRVNVLVQHPDASTESGVGTLTDFPLEAPHDDVATISGTIQGSGELTPA